MTAPNVLSERRTTTIHSLWAAVTNGCLQNGGDHIYYHELKRLARQIMGHPSKRRMLDYFEDMEDSKWIEIDGMNVQLLDVPPDLREKFERKLNSTLKMPVAAAPHGPR